MNTNKKNTSRHASLWRIFSIILSAIILTSCSSSLPDTQTIKESGMRIEMHSDAVNLKSEIKKGARVGARAARSIGQKFRGEKIEVKIKKPKDSKTIADSTNFGTGSIIRVYKPGHKEIVAAIAHEFAHAILHSNGTYGHIKQLDNKGLLWWKEMRKAYNE